MDEDLGVDEPVYFDTVDVVSIVTGRLYSDVDRLRAILRSFAGDPNLKVDDLAELRVRVAEHISLLDPKFAAASRRVGYAYDYVQPLYNLLQKFGRKYKTFPLNGTGFKYLPSSFYSKCWTRSEKKNLGTIAREKEEREGKGQRGRHSLSFTGSSSEPKDRKVFVKKQRSSFFQYRGRSKSSCNFYVLQASCEGWR